MSNITIYRFALDMTPGGVTPVVHLSQYDEAFQLEFTLYSRSGELDIPSGATAMIEGTKLDGKAYSANATISGNVVTVAGDVQISAVAGNNPFQIVLKSGNSTVGSANFTIAVERAAMDYDTVSDSKLAQIQDVTATAAQLTAAAENVTDGVETFEALAESVSDMLEDIVDDTLSISGKAADAAKTGEELSNLKSDFNGAIIYHDKLTVENIVTPKLTNYLGLTFDWMANGLLKITGTSTKSINVAVADVPVKSGVKYRWRIFSGTLPEGVSLFLYGVKGGTSWIDAPYEWVENAERAIYLKIAVAAGVTFNDTLCFAVSTEKTNTELENDTNNIFQQINPIAQHDFSGMADSFVIGSIYSVDANGTVNVYGTQKHRICIKKAIKCDFDVTITAEPGYRFGPWLLENGVFVDKGWKTSYKIPANTHFVLQIGATDDSEYADISTFLTKITTNQILTTIAPAFYKSERYNKSSFGFNTAVKSIAHQGLRLYAPANTRPAFIDAKNYGYNFVETDVRTTSDGVIVINHDDNIAWTKDFYDITSGTPTLVTTDTLISQTTYSDLYNNYDIRHSADDKFAGNKIMTLDEFLMLCKKINLHPYIELKYANGIGITNGVEVVDKIKKYGMLKQCTIITAADHLLTQIKKAGYTTIRMGFLNMGVFGANAVNVYNSLKSDFNDMFVDVPCDLQTAESIDLAISNNVPLEAYNVNKSRLETISPYYTGYTADYVVASTYFYDSVVGVSD